MKRFLIAMALAAGLFGLSAMIDPEEAASQIGYGYSGATSITLSGDPGFTIPDTSGYAVFAGSSTTSQNQINFIEDSGGNVAFAYRFGSLGTTGSFRFTEPGGLVDDASFVLIDGTTGVIAAAETFMGLELEFTMSDHTGGEFRAISVEAITADAQAVETAIHIETGWDNSIIAFGPMEVNANSLNIVINNLADSAQVATIGRNGSTGGFFVNGVTAETLIQTGASATYLELKTNQAVATGNIRFTPAASQAGASKDFVAATATAGIMNGSDTLNMNLQTFTNANHTGTGNTVNLLSIAALTGDAESNLNAINIGTLTGTTGSASEVEAAIKIAAGWDTDIEAVTDLSLTVDGNDLGVWKVATGEITNAQLKVLNATPITVISAAGSGIGIVVESWQLHLDFATAAFDGVAAGEDLRLQYVTANGLAAHCDSATCIDAAASADAYGIDTGYHDTGAGDTPPVDNDGIEMTIINGEWFAAAGGSSMRYIIRYREITLDQS